MQDTILPDEKTYEAELGYWKSKLQGASPLLLTTDFNRTTSPGNSVSAIKFIVDPEIAKQIDALAKSEDADVLSVLISVFKVLLYRYSSQEDICVGNNTAFNVLTLRSSITGEDQFSDLLKRVKNTTLEAYQNQQIPFETVADAFLKDRKGQNPFFNITFLLNENEVTTTLSETSNYDISFVLNKTSEAISGEIFYNSSLFRQSTIDRLAGHYLQLIGSIISDPQSKVGALPMLTAEEAHDILVKFNDTLTWYPAEKTIVDIFEEQVKKTPDAIAMRQHEETMTYRELNEKANQLAHYLVEQGAKRADNIGLITARGFSMIIGMYGIMKAGGAYVPIDPEYPIDRQEYILQNSSAIKVIADGDYPLKDLIKPEQFVKLPTLDLVAYGTEDIGLKIDSKQLAYTIYTSGSTGRPKGVMIEHHSAVNLCLWVNKEYNIGADDRLLFITSMCFDLSVYDIFGILAAGGSIVIVEQQELMDVPKLKEMMLKYKITFWDSVPTTMDYL
ncbi:MAG TPA: AMP-binding protein, partial [Mucilaginibacter sp.]|nr:AMP-binding protein [Mucilaginibacter sp.]